MSRVFSNLLSDRLGPRAPKKRKIAIITPYIMGSANGSGVGTASHSLAEHLVRQGHSVTLILTKDAYKQSQFQIWQEYYRKMGAELSFLPEPSVPFDGRKPMRNSYSAYLCLKDRDFDIVHFPELYGLGYYSVLAKKQGLAFENTLLCVTVNGPSLWHRLQNRQSGHFEDLAYDFMERRSTELADVVTAPSQYILNWVVSRGWKLPKRTYVEQYLLSSLAKTRQTKQRRIPKEIVFFGRLETRKGLEIFLAALDLLPRELLRSTSVTFLGSHGLLQGIHSQKFLKRSLRSRNLSWKVIPDYDQGKALDYLRTHSVLAVLPSVSESLGFTAIECVASGIPFIASRIPAYEELILTRDQHQVLFDPNPTALAQKLEQVLRSGAPWRPRFAVTPKVTSDHWRQWHLRVSTGSNSQKRREATPPKISVCVTHRNRPEFLQQCLRSLQEQTVPPYEVLVIDDCSDSEEAIQYLRKLAKHPRAMGFRFRLLRKKTCSGPVDCRNAAAAAAKGEYLLFMDDDNVAKSEELETFVRVAQRTQADIVTCAFDSFTGNQYPNAKTRFKRWIPLGESLTIGLYNNLFGEMNSLVRRKAFLELGGLTWGEGGNEDAEFFARAVIRGYHLTAVPEALFWKRIHGENLGLALDPYLGYLHRMSAYRELFPHPDLFDLHESVLRPMSFAEWTSKYRHQARPDRSLERSQRFSKRVYSAASPTDFSKWKADSGIKMVQEPGRLKISVTKPSAEITLPRFSVPSGRQILLNVEVSGFQTNFMDFRCSARDKSGKCESIVVGSPFDMGHRLVQIVVPSGKQRHLQGPFRLRPSGKAETVFIRKLEVLA